MISCTFRARKSTQPEGGGQVDKKNTGFREPLLAAALEVADAVPQETRHKSYVSIRKACEGLPEMQASIQQKMRAGLERAMEAADVAPKKERCLLYARVHEECHDFPELQASAREKMLASVQDVPANEQGPAHLMIAKYFDPESAERRACVSLAYAHVETLPYPFKHTYTLQVIRLLTDGHPDAGKIRMQAVRNIRHLQPAWQGWAATAVDAAIPQDKSSARKALNQLMKQLAPPGTVEDFAAKMGSLDRQPPPGKGGFRGEFTPKKP